MVNFPVICSCNTAMQYRAEEKVAEITDHAVYYRRQEQTDNELAVMECTTGGRNRSSKKLLSWSVLQEGGTDGQ